MLSSSLTAEPLTPVLSVALVIVGVVSVLFVNVCVPANVATVESIAIEMSLSDTVVSIPVPPVKFNVSVARATVSSEPESAPTVNDVVIDAVLAAVIKPLALTVITGIAVVEPNEPVFELTVANVNAPVSARVASPDMTLSIQTELPVS